MDTSARVGTAVAAGYVLGRFKKLRLAVIVGSALANKNLRDVTAGLLRQGFGGPTSSTGAAVITEPAGPHLMDVGKTALVAAATSRMERLSDRLAERTEALHERDGVVADDEADEEAEDEYDEDEEPEDKAPAASRRGSRSARPPARAARRTRARAPARARS